MSYPLETSNGVITTWLPLTTTYTSNSAATCTNLFRGVPAGLLAFDPNYGTIDSSWKCMPSQASTWWAQYSNGPAYATNYGIGPITCPEDWQTVQTSVKDETSTFAMCCPSGYKRSDGSLGNVIVSIVGEQPDQNYAFGCMSTVTPGVVVNSRGPSNTQPTTFTETSFVLALAIVGMNRGSATISTTSSVPVTTSSQNPATAASSQTAPSQTPSSAASASLKPTNTSATTIPGTGLSIGAKTGIAVGVAIGALLIIGLTVAVVILFRRTRQRHSMVKVFGHQGTSEHIPSAGQTQYGSKAELHSSPMLQYRAELEDFGFKR